MTGDQLVELRTVLARNALALATRWRAARLPAAALVVHNTRGLGRQRVPAPGCVRARQNFVVTAHCGAREAFLDVTSRVHAYREALLISCVWSTR